MLPTDAPAFAQTLQRSWRISRRNPAFSPSARAAHTVLPGSAAPAPGSEPVRAEGFPLRWGSRRCWRDSFLRLHSHRENQHQHSYYCWRGPQPVDSVSEFAGPAGDHCRQLPSSRFARVGCACAGLDYSISLRKFWWHMIVVSCEHTYRHSLFRMSANHRRLHHRLIERCPGG